MQPQQLKKVSAPLSFIVAIVATAALLIFFGAWAVSADSASRERALSLALPGGVSGYAAPQTQAQQTETQKFLQSFDQAQAGDTAADKWWGKALLTACPLH